MINLYRGQLVSTKENDWGTGKVLDIDNNKITIEYFDSPVEEERESTIVFQESVQPVHLYKQTRIYFFDEEYSRWLSGRILFDKNSNYVIALPQQKQIELPEEQIFVRWNFPIIDPFAQLEHKNNESPYFYYGRSEFVKSLIEQRRSIAGMTGLISSSIELEEHQIEVIKRVLTDPIQRYLLADEVGLGKTIESGVVIRQTVLDHPNNYKILIVVPNHLVDQWREELCDKFFLNEYIDKSIFIIPSNNLIEIKKLSKKIDMLVIDEAHHIASYADSPIIERKEQFKIINEIAIRSQKLLLLSATPVLHNEKAFLAMLHLLDPAIYSLNDEKSFKDKINKRQQIAEIFFNFTSETPGFFMNDYSNELKRAFPKDKRLNYLLNKLEPYLEFGIDEENSVRINLINSIRSHISETYKLHRRLLRNRRTDDKEVLITGRNGLKTILFTDIKYNEIEELLDKWRIEASLLNPQSPKDDLCELFKILFEAFLSDLNLLKVIILERIGTSKTQTDKNKFHEVNFSFIKDVPQFENEKDILNKILKIIKNTSDLDDQKFSKLTGLLEKNINESQKNVIFCNNKATADDLFQKLSISFKNSIVRHSPNFDSKSQDRTNWYRFKYDPECWILISDRHSEEGLNLQGGHANIIHFDIPLSPNRIEQRIGRLDRYGYGEAVQSFILQFSSSSLQSSWITFLNEIIKVFNRSIASLQFFINEEMKKFWRDFLIEGREILDEKIEEFGGEEGKIEQELIRIKQQDELDAIEIIEDDGDDWIEKIFETDFNGKAIQKATESWIINCLCFKHEGHNTNKKIIRYKHSEYTLTPVNDLVGRFQGVIDINNRNFNLHKPSTFELTYDRETALRKKTRIARIGNPFIDAMHKYILWDDRGSCFAMWRYHNDVKLLNPVELFFCINFIVETDPSKAIELVCGKQKISKEAIKDVIQRKGDYYFKPFMHRIWIDENLELVQDNNKLKLLEEPYRRKKDVNGRDYNLNKDRWMVLENDYDSYIWSQICTSMKKAALKHLYEQVNLKNLIQDSVLKTKEKTSVVHDQLKSRIASLDSTEHSFEEKQLKFEEAFSESLISGIINPSITSDSVGAIFLSTHNPFRENNE